MIFLLHLIYWNPGRFALITCSPRVDSPWVVSPRKVSRFAPLNRYYIIIVEVFFDNFLLIIYLIVVCKKKVIIHSFWSTFVKDLNRNFLVTFSKNHTWTVKIYFFVPTQKCMKWLRCCTNAQITSFLMNYASNAKIV